MTKRVGPGIPVPDTRNPFGGKGLAVTLALLLHPRRAQSIAELAENAQTSRPLASMVVRELRRLRLVDGEVSQGRAGTLRPKPELLYEAAPHWPTPVAAVMGGTPSLVDLPIGGGPAARSWLPSVWDPPPRAYVRSTDAVYELLSDTGGHLIAGGAADWEIAVVDYPFAPGVVPRVVVALELGATPRGREMLTRHLADVTLGWAVDR
ncbi:MAG: hypothetical protein KDB35_15360 [Acidimicrobiales bacterium]|nr:hypothetical protein [Acidimicrobiales bacterium]MCB1017548.1 hypothetical protein [Acidimicrobiales bacterium]